MTEQELNELKAKAKKWDDFKKALQEKWYEGYNEETGEYEDGYDLINIGEWVGSYMGMFG